MNDTGDTIPQWTAPPPRLVLRPGEIHIFAFSLDVPASWLREVEQLLSGDESARAKRFRQSRDRRRYVVGRAQLRTILGHYLGLHPARLQFRYGSHGKPALLGGGSHEHVRFSLSRSHELGVVAVQLDDDLGVDVEHIRAFPDALQVADRFFAREENEALRSIPIVELDAVFFSYWTRKEAIIKSLGLGLSHPMDAFKLACNPGGVAERIAVTSPLGAVVRWSLPVPPPSERYVAALATAGSVRPVRCWAWGGP